MANNLVWNKHRQEWVPPSRALERDDHRIQSSWETVLGVQTSPNHGDNGAFTERLHGGRREASGPSFGRSSPGGDVDGILREMRAKIKSRGATTIGGLGRHFRIVDDSGNGQIDGEEFVKTMREYGFNLSREELQAVHARFDTDGSGTISYDEFLRGVREPMSARRQAMVTMAYNVLDRNGDGRVTAADLLNVYDSSKHPDVIQGRKTHREVIEDFMAQWDRSNNDRIITREEFLDYYTDVSVSVDTDDYFELMIRNAWHISGGQGWSQNTANLRVCVTHSDGREEVIGISDDLGLDTSDVDGIQKRLLEQGVRDIVKINDVHVRPLHASMPLRPKASPPSSPSGPVSPPSRPARASQASPPSSQTAAWPSSPSSGGERQGKPVARRKRALLIGINYVGTRYKLSGCQNDVAVHKKIWTEVLGVPDTSSNMRVLTELQPPSGQPTKANILEGLNWLVDGAKDGDLLLLHFSGHGSQAPTPDRDEMDGLNETIVPLDVDQNHMISDDEITEVFSCLPAGVCVHAQFDCCHSATLVDGLQTRYIRNMPPPTQPPSREGVKNRAFPHPPHVATRVERLKYTNEPRAKKRTRGCEAKIHLISGCRDHQTSADAYEGGKAIGAMSWALSEEWAAAGYHLTYRQLLERIAQRLRGKYDQNPQLSTFEEVDVDDVVCSHSGQAVPSRDAHGTRGHSGSQGSRTPRQYRGVSEGRQIVMMQSPHEYAAYQRSGGSADVMWSKHMRAWASPEDHARELASPPSPRASSYDIIGHTSDRRSDRGDLSTRSRSGDGPWEPSTRGRPTYYLGRSVSPVDDHSRSSHRYH